MNWKIPIDLKRAREHLEVNPPSLDEVPGNLCTVGILSGYRILNHTAEFREIQFAISQGGNEELRLTYIG